MPTHTKTLGKGIRQERCFKTEQDPFIAQPHQEKVKDYFLNSPYRGLLLYHKLGSGKCMKIDTPIMLNNGKIKMVQDIKVGDLLMGDDSTPRTVTSLARGEDEMYEIIPVKGDSYTVNQEHILCLKASGYPRINHANDKTNTNYNVQYIENNKFMSRTFSYKKNDTDDEQKKKDEAENFFNNISHDNIMEMSVIEYLKLSKMKKACLKTYRVPVEFPEQKVTIDPYMIGYWLGDGTSNKSQITTEDKEVVNYFEKFCNDNNHRLYQGRRSIIARNDLHYTLYGSIKGKPKSNIFLNSLKENNLINNKHIPDIYKYNSRENRLKLLAGLIDSDGSLDNGCFEFSQSIEKEKLFDDVIYLARSLGFACYKSKKQTTCKNKKGEIIEGEAWRMHISGSGIEEIPTKIRRKQAKIRKQIKDVLVSGIEVKHVGRDNYYGFTLDGNCRYLLGDFTVTHNTCTSIIIADEMLEKGMIDHVYVCTPGSLRKNFTTEYCDLCGEQEKLKENFTFITYNTNIFKAIEKLDFNNSLVIIDEAHNLINGAKNITKNPYALYNQILNSTARVLVLTATIIYNNLYEWCLLGNLLKDDTFPNIIETGALDKTLFEENITEIFSKKNLEGIVSYYPGFKTDYPDVIYHAPIIVPMTSKQEPEWYKIQDREELTRIKGPPKAADYRKDPIKAQQDNTFYIMAQKYILSRSISNAHYLSFMIRRELNEDEKNIVDYYLKKFFEKKNIPTKEHIYKKVVEVEHEEEEENYDYKKFIKIKTTAKKQESCIDLIKLIIKEIHVMAPTYTDIINLGMTYGQIREYIEKSLISQKFASKIELSEEIDIKGVIKIELDRMKKKEEGEEVDEEVDEGWEEIDGGILDDIDYCNKCKVSLKNNNINSKKSFYKWSLKNHPDKKGKAGEEIFKEISSCYYDWIKDSKCQLLMNTNIIFDNILGEETLEQEKEKKRKEQEERLRKEQEEQERIRQEEIKARAEEERIKERIRKEDERLREEEIKARAEEERIKERIRKEDERLREEEERIRKEEQEIIRQEKKERLRKVEEERIRKVVEEIKARAEEERIKERIRKEEERLRQEEEERLRQEQKERLRKVEEERIRKAVELAKRIRKEVEEAKRLRQEEIKARAEEERIKERIRKEEERLRQEDEERLREEEEERLREEEERLRQEEEERKDDEDEEEEKEDDEEVDEDKEEDKEEEEKKGGQEKNDIFNICNICMRPLKYEGGPNLIYKLDCSDVFHYNCIKQYVDNITHIENKKCPVCGIHIEGKINKENAKPYKYKAVTDTFVKDGGWINKEIFQNKLLMVISPKILTIILNILKNFNSKHVIFSFFLEKAGIRLISNILKMCGINTILYHGDLSPETRANLLKKFNKKNNIYGEKFKVFLSTDAGYEGITLKEVGHVHFLETNTIPNKTLQAIGRAVRYKSHIRLPENKRVVNIWKYFSTPIGYQGKIKDFNTFNLELNTFDEYYKYYVKGGFINYLNKKYGKGSLTFGVGTDELLNNKGTYKVEEFKDFYEMLQENSIEKTGLINNYKKREVEKEESEEEEEESEEEEEYESEVSPIILEEDEEVIEEED
jgi:hypothetical protein